MEEKTEKIEVAAKKTWKVLMAWVGGITALIAFVGTVAGGVTWLINHHRNSVEYKARMASAQSETGQEQYAEALKTYGEILKDDPLNGPALDAQLDTAMLWTENFSVYVPEGKDERDLAGSGLDTIFPVLTRGLSRATQAARQADIEAHLGWAHFLNAKMTEREDDSVAVKDWHDALSRDPTNVYANAMLGNWMLQSSRNFKGSVLNFNTAVQTGRARPFVRRLQLGGLLHLEMSGARAETVRVANEMRKDGEELNAGERQRIRDWCFGSLASHQELFEALGAVPNDQAWQTYLWLDTSDGSGSEDEHDLNHEFIHANLLELSGSRDAALNEFQKIRGKLEDRPGMLRDQVQAEIKRLAHG
jgi:tetratricopeptide (TPR) repeat protein